MRGTTVVLAATVAVLAGCSSTTTKTAAKCAPVPDHFLKEGRPVYRSCGVNRSARGPTFSSGWRYSPTQTCGAAKIEFVVDEYGVPNRATARVVSGNDVRMGEEMILFLTSMRYQPARRGGVAVQQLTSFQRSYSVRISSTAVPGAVSRAQGGARC